jgi:hypothetical protein
MADHRRPEFEIGHPAPDRDQVRLAALGFGLAGGPAAWCLQLLAGSSVAGLACLAGDGSSTGSLNFGWATPAMIGVNLAALLVAILALVVSFRSFRRTASGYAEGHDSVMEAGEGRSRFLAIWGIWTSILFILAIAFNTISVFWGGLCDI